MLVPDAGDALWTPPPDDRQTGQRRPGPAPSRTSPTIPSIVEAHLFGTAIRIGRAGTSVETENAPDTRLNLKLRAAVAASDNEVAHAIIADGSGNEKVYFIRSSIPGGATLHRVHADRVILNRGGVLETLRLPREFEGKARSGHHASGRTSAARATPRPQGNVQQLIATNNAASFAEIIRPQPFMPNGQLKGYRVFPGRNRQQFIALGLRPGDLVTAINGVRTE